MIRYAKYPTRCHLCWHTVMPGDVCDAAWGTTVCSDCAGIDHVPAGDWDDPFTAPWEQEHVDTLVEYLPYTSNGGAFKKGRNSWVLHFHS
jgi:hypothetical protein